MYLAKIEKTFILKILLCLLPFIYFFLYGRYGLNDTDDGYITALSWRVINGELPYKDFIYVRPPLSIYLHTLPLLLMPENYAYISERLFFYITIAIYSYLSADLLCKFWLKDNSKDVKYLFALVSFVFSAHNFPPMAWHTTDGIFWSVLGVYILASYEGNVWAVVFSSLFMFMAALCKQSFYPIIPIGLVVAFVLYGNKKLLLLLGGFVFLTLLFYVVLCSKDLFAGFVEQTFFDEAGNDFVKSAILSYVTKIHFKHYIVIVVLLGVMWFRYVKYSAYFAVLALLSVLTSLLYEHHNVSLFVKPRGYPQVWFAFAVLCSLYGLFKDYKDKRIWVLLALLGVSWCAGISWGYRSPLLFATPLLFAFIYLISEYRQKLLKFSLIIVLLSSLGCFYALNQYRYMDNQKSEMIYNMGSVYPRLSGVMADKQTYEQYKELSVLIANYGNNFTVFPEMPQANYVTNTNNPALSDWVMDCELAGKYDDVLADIASKGSYVFMLNNPRVKIMKNNSFGSKVSIEVQKNWHLIERRQFLSVYKKESVFAEQVGRINRHLI